MTTPTRLAAARGYHYAAAAPSQDHAAAAQITRTHLYSTPSPARSPTPSQTNSPKQQPAAAATARGTTPVRARAVELMHTAPSPSAFDWRRYECARQAGRQAGRLAGRQAWHKQGIGMAQAWHRHGLGIA